MDLGPCIESQGGMFPTGTLAMEHHHFSRSFYLHIDLQPSTHCDLLEYIYIIQIHISIQEMVPEFLVPCIFVPSLEQTKHTPVPPNSCWNSTRLGISCFGFGWFQNPPASWKIHQPAWQDPDDDFDGLYFRASLRGTAFSCLMVEIPTVDGEA